MARVLLILAHLPQRMGAPYLGQQYIAASLLNDGHEVRCLDLAALRFSGADEDAMRIADDYAPDMIGMTLFTNNARRSYDLAAKLQKPNRLLVAGGPHPTVLPKEPLDFGFDISVIGEGEETAVLLARYLDGHYPLPQIAGIYSQQHGAHAHKNALQDLDQLAFPLHSYPCYEPSWYAEQALVVPGGLMSSRGCPARCTFCANYVTGRVYRWRSAHNVVAEMVALKAQYGLNHFQFWDDAFTARRSRLNDLCAAIMAEPQLTGCTWTCITPANMVKPFDLQQMRKAGCVAVNFGIESGDYNILKIIQKGQKPEQVRVAVEAAKNNGMMTIVNFMFGFPGEHIEALNNTLQFMQALAPATDYFNTRGVLVPFPGTPVYQQWKDHYGFQNWWLNPEMVPDEPDPLTMTAHELQLALQHDPTLDLDFFHYDSALRAQIAACVRFKAQHNQQTIARLQRAA